MPIVTIWRDADDGGGFLLIEEWETPQRLEEHMRSPAFRRFLEVLELSQVRRRFCTSRGCVCVGWTG